MFSKKSKPLYPEVTVTNPEAISSHSSSSTSSSLYPSIDKVAENLFPETDVAVTENMNSQPCEEVLVKVPGAIVHLIDKQESIELASGEFVVVRLRQGENVIAVLARVGNDIQWPLAKDEAVVKLDQSHYFFTLRVPAGGGDGDERESTGDGGRESESMMSYGLTIASKGQDRLLEELDGVLKNYSSFSTKEVGNLGVLNGSVARETSPEELGSEKKMEIMERSSSAYWTTLAPNVEDYNGMFARMIAAGSGHLIRGILWCGDVTSDRLRWGNEFMKKRSKPGSSSEFSPDAMIRMQRAKALTKMCDKMANGVLSGVLKVSGFFTSSVVNTKVGKKFFSLLPGEIILASLDGFNKVCDAVELAGRNVMSTTSVVTTEVVSHRYGDQAGSITNEGLTAVGYTIGTAWAVFKIRKAFNPKSVFKPTNVARAASKSSNSPESAAKSSSSSELKAIKK